MRQTNRWLLIYSLILLTAISGCDMSRPSTRPSLSENSRFRFMDIRNIDTCCSRSEDLDAMRVDAQRLNRAADPIPSENIESVLSAPIIRLPVDPAAMAAAYTLASWPNRTGHRAP
jgi:hypothetical protein